MHSKTTTHLPGGLKDVSSLAWPLVLGMLSFTVMDVTDTLMVARLGTAELVAVGIATTVLFFINSFFIGFFEGVKILVAQATGAKQETMAKQAGWQGVFISLPCGALVALLSIFSSEIFSIFGLSQHVQQLAVDYFSIRVFASPFWLITLAVSNYFQGIGNTKLPMRVNIIMALINFVFCQVLIFGVGSFEGMGVSGSAYATIIADVIGVIILLYFLIKKAKIPLTWFTDIANKLLKLGFPLGTRWLLDTGGWTLVIAMISKIGEFELAANQIATRLMCLSILPVYGIAETASILTGRFTGAQNMPALKRSYVSSMKLSLIVMGSFAILFFAFPITLLSIFNAEPEIILLGSQVLVFIGIFQLFVAFSMTTAGALNGTGDTRFTMYLSIFSSWFLMVPLAYTFGFVFGFGVFGMWSALIIQQVFLALAMLWRFRSGKWKKYKLITK